MVDLRYQTSDLSIFPICRIFQVSTSMQRPFNKTKYSNTVNCTLLTENQGQEKIVGQSQSR